VTDSRQAVV